MKNAIASKQIVSIGLISDVSDQKIKVQAKKSSDILSRSDWNFVAENCFEAIARKTSDFSKRYLPRLVFLNSSTVNYHYQYYTKLAKSIDIIQLCIVTFTRQFQSFILNPFYVDRILIQLLRVINNFNKWALLTYVFLFTHRLIIKRFQLGPIVVSLVFIATLRLIFESKVVSSIILKRCIKHI